MPADSNPILRYSSSVEELAGLEPLWNALQAHHSSVLPQLADGAPSRGLDDSWGRRRAKYEGWLRAPETFFVIAEIAAEPVGYAFVTVGPGYAGWETGERLAELETLSVLPARRAEGVGSALLDAVWAQLEESGVDEMAITTAMANVDSHRFYERNGFQQRFAIYYSRRPSH